MKLIKELNHYSSIREDIEHFTMPSQSPGVNTGVGYTVYKVTGPNTEKTYYGYVKGTGDEAIRKAFFTAAGRQGQEHEGRGVKQLVDANGGDEDLEFEVLDVTDTEEDAFKMRNLEREGDSTSVTGASVWPDYIHRKVSAENPEYVQKMQMIRDLNKCKNAREAWAKKFFDSAAIKALPSQHNKQEVIRDLDALTPHMFSKKYGVQFVNL